MDLSALGSTLPPGLAEAEREMGDKFRASALSITTLYKSSLGYTKQAYQVGYRACLSDVLSAVQSSIGGGQDASQTLSRLMDWAEARETAMAAFAEDDDPPSTSHPQSQSPSQPLPRRPTSTRQASNHTTNRPNSASLPLADTLRTPLPAMPPSSDIDSAGLSRRRNSGYDEEEGALDPDKTFVAGSTPLQSPTQAQPGGAGTGLEMTPMSSPTASAGPSRLSASTGGHRHSRSPLRYRHLPPSSLNNPNSNPNTLTSIPPSASFQPSLPPNVLSLPSASPAIGSKRPIATVHMLDPDITMSGDTGSGGGSGRGKASKRRNLGGTKQDEDKDGGEKGEKRRGRKGKEGGGGAV